MQSSSLWIIPYRSRDVRKVCKDLRKLSGTSYIDSSQVRTQFLGTLRKENAHAIALIEQLDAIMSVTYLLGGQHLEVTREARSEKTCSSPFVYITFKSALQAAMDDAKGFKTS